VAIKAETSQPKWYLVRTRQHKEAFVNDTLCKVCAGTFLPLLRIKQWQWGRLANKVGPLFPCYLFIHLDLTAQYYTVQRTPGVVGLVSAGTEPIEVQQCIVDEIKRRAANGIVEVSPQTLRTGESVELMQGPLRGISGIFERYLSGPQRVTLLVQLLGAASVRVVAPTEMVARSRDNCT
jgi:transcriptional antiterminator RfaH